MRQEVHVNLVNGKSVTMRVGIPPLTTRNWDEAGLLDSQGVAGYCVAHRVGATGALEIAVASWGLSPAHAVGAAAPETWNHDVRLDRVSSRRVFAPGTWASVEYTDE